MNIDNTNSKTAPFYRQVYQQLRQAILSGQLAAGERLPASRRLAASLGLSRNVVLMAYDQLQAEGYVEGRVGAGTFVTASLLDPYAEHYPVPEVGPALIPRLAGYAQRVMQRHVERPTETDPPRYDFRFGAVAVDRHSVRIWRRLLTRHAERVLTEESPVQGYSPLRRVIVEYLRRSRGILCHPEQIVVVNGTQQALDLIARIFLDPGDRVVIEEPHYPGAREVFLAAGAELHPCPVDEEGLMLDRLPAEGARLICTTPANQFPTGAVLSLARRLALLEWARCQQAYLIEDDYDSEYRYEGRPLEALQALDREGRTLYIGTFSKHLFPALRLGFLIVPDKLVEVFRATKYLADRHSPILHQVVLADFIGEGHFERHLRRMRAANERRRITLVKALQRELGERIRVMGNNAGVHLVIWLPELPLARLTELVDRVRQQDVGVYPITPMFHCPPPQAGLLLGYEALSEAGIIEGVRRLAQLVRESF